MYEQFAVVWPIFLMLQIEEADTDADVRTGWVLDNFPKNLLQTNDLQQAEILPDVLFYLRDSDGHQGTKHRIVAWQISCFV